MVPRYAYTGSHERETISPEHTTYRFLLVLAMADFDREELSQLPNQAGMIAKPFSVNASILLSYNEPVRDLYLEG